MDKKMFYKCIDAEILRFLPKLKLPRFIKLLLIINLEPSCRAIYYIRKMQYYSKSKFFIFRLLSRLYNVKLVREFGICIGADSQIGIGLHIPHPTSIVIGGSVKIGKNFSIYQNCTVGGARTGDVKKGNQPTIGDNVTLFSGSMILGRITVADNITIGANSVLLKDALSEGVYVGNPAKRQERRNNP